MSVERRRLPATDLEVSALGIDLTGPLPRHADAVLHRALSDGVNLFRIPLGDAGRGARRCLRNVGSGLGSTLVMVGVLPHELAERAPTLLTGLERELSTPHRAIIEVRPPDLSLVRSILPLNPRPGAPTGRATVGVRVDPPYVGGVDATPADFVSVAHSLWQPGILPSPDPVPATGAPGVLAIDPWAGLMGNEGPRVGSVNPGPHGPVPISRLRQEAIRLIGLVDLVRLEGRPLPEIAVRYALDSPGVSATLLTLPSPEFWTAALRAAENGPLTRREQEWIHRYGPRPGLDPGVASDRPQR